MSESQPRVNRAAWVKAEKGPVEVSDAPIVEPEKGQVLIRTQAAAITPMDGLMITKPVMKLNYPTIFSSVAAGFVDSIGEGVTRVKVGDRVVSGTNIWPSKGDPKLGGMQRFTIVEEEEVLEIGDLDFGTAIASSIQTAVYALFSPSALGMDRPTNPSNPVPNGKKILIWGGSGAMGALAISHAKAAGYTVISTSSPRNFDLLKERGASHVFDYNDEEATIDKIRELLPIDHFYDAVSLPESLSALFKLLTKENGEVIKAEILTLYPISMLGLTVPEGITANFMRFRNAAPENKELVDWTCRKGGYLETGMKEGWIRGVKPESIGGLDAVSKGLERRAIPGLRGVSGARLIVEPWKW